MVDGTRDALHASVSSLYLLDRGGLQLTLAATTGLDRHHIGRVTVPFGEGITGRVAASREPIAVPDIAEDSRFLWVRGLDQRRFIASMLSVPLTWRDQVVGVLNVQTEARRAFSPTDIAQLSAIADLLAGIVEKGRLQREAEAQVAQLRALDQARSELIALVTHELRTPLAVVRAYTDLLSEEPTLDGRASRDPTRRATRASWRQGTVDQIERLDRLVDTILESVRVVPDQPAQLASLDLHAIVTEVVAELGAVAAPAPGRHRPLAAAARGGRPGAPAAGPGASPGERREVRPARLAGRAGLDAGRGRRPSRGHRRWPRDPAGVAGADLRTLRKAPDADGAGVRHRALRGAAAGRIDGRTTMVRACTHGRGPLRAGPARGRRRLTRR